jgi:hypothetical protein
MPRLKVDQYESVYAGFNAPVSQRYDCGQYCAPHNNGQPVCCTTQYAIPVATIEEWNYLKVRTDLWHPYKPHDKAEQKVKEDLPHYCKMIECKGAQSCEREHRTLSCRAFPFFPYVTKNYEFVGLAYYWTFEEKCWVINNLQIVEKSFVDEFVSTFDHLFGKVEGELETFRDHSASMRRVFSRRGTTIPLIGRDGNYYEVIPKTGEIQPAKIETFEKFGVFKD